LLQDCDSIAEPTIGAKVGGVTSFIRMLNVYLRMYAFVNVCKRIYS